jgi:D-lactate dehydrogenase
MQKLLQPDPSLIEPREHPPTHDRAPDELAEGTPQWLRDDLVAILGDSQHL